MSKPILIVSYMPPCMYSINVVLCQKVFSPKIFAKSSTFSLYVGRKVEDSGFPHFFDDWIKVKIPTEIKPPLHYCTKCHGAYFIHTSLTQGNSKNFTLCFFPF